jgi:ATP-dependent Clp protease adaptor protein ClpS
MTASMIDTNDSVATVKAPAKKTAAPVRRPKKLPPYHVILLDDDDHTYEYVIDMLRKLFGLAPERAFEVAREVDTAGRVILDTTTKERAEFKRDQVGAFGRDWRIARCEGSMTALVVPAE